MDTLKTYSLLSNASTLCTDFVLMVSTNKQNGFTITGTDSVYDYRQLFPVAYMRIVMSIFRYDFASFHQKRDQKFESLH